MMPVANQQILQALVRLRVELFTAAQVLRGEQLEDFWKLIDEVGQIRPDAGEVIRLRADLRREQDARADLRLELDRVRQERDEARRELVAAMRTIEEGARG